MDFVPGNELYPGVVIKSVSPLTPDERMAQCFTCDVFQDKGEMTVRAYAVGDDPNSLQYFHLRCAESEVVHVQGRKVTVFVGADGNVRVEAPEDVTVNVVREDLG
ncbi:hypothetical protein [Amycolatopsis sp. DSM 110486]|uniref:hypothetical protein n=1 Tax=Amycolatopsis sp. DSM 110486 TaxID=2865832 RepID=UPI001C6A07AE|nr:hypothetical protein [Amycolatopsis sp. DSM 110486]QYN17524.1 hypothetical protein K1T34_32580 [Amycolatopsis sp. DSM 110486]